MKQIDFTTWFPRTVTQWRMLWCAFTKTSATLSCSTLAAPNSQAWPRCCSIVCWSQKDQSLLIQAGHKIWNEKRKIVRPKIPSVLLRSICILFYHSCIICDVFTSDAISHIPCLYSDTRTTTINFAIRDLYFCSEHVIFLVEALKGFRKEEGNAI